ncbi:hypothetical protein EYF80_067576 [Liparis tanakae]|uniref:Uncharacterized protein n=1 Tax=Liparis tanakae TaxID=230148 RepID=A0A4Z2E1E9_9TELE|nr:hypothetical protein EYF80_067576 [Liparis tanakae]
MCLPSFLNPGTRSTKVATPPLSGCGRRARKWWPKLPTASRSVFRASSISCCTDSLMRQAGSDRLHADSRFLLSGASSSGAASGFAFSSAAGGRSLGRRSL